MYETCAKSIFGGNIYVCSKFSCVRSSHDLCACTHAHDLEGTLVAIQSKFKKSQNPRYRSSGKACTLHSCHNEQF